MGVELRLLGEIEARVDGRPVDLGHARQKCVLAALLIEANRPVPVDQLLDRIWADRQPQRARNTLSGYLSRLRQALATTEDVSLTRRPGAYLLAVDPMAVDMHRFHLLVAQGRAAEDDEEAARLFGRALGLWRGDAFGTLDTPWLNAIREGLNADRLAAVLDRNDLALRMGQHAELLGDLSTLAVAHPLDERLAGQLMLALCRCGRQSDALRHFERIRALLAEELGADPSPPLRRLHQQIVSADPALTMAASTTEPAMPRLPASPVPRQLPAPPRSFTGRARELADLDAVLASAGNQNAAVVISALSGTAGVGKTAVAVHWAHRVAHLFGDGQLYVNLRGFAPGGAVVRPAEALRAFLDALGVLPLRIPASLEAQAALYRSLLAGKRMLIVLDNARDVEQVRPLLPGSPGCLVVVTSRNQLIGLVAADGAHPVTLDLLTPAEARDFLINRIGPHRVAAETEAVDEIIIRCARLPLALAMVAARAATRPDSSLEEMATLLRDTRGGLDALADTDTTTDVRAVFSWSYLILNTEAARLFRQLGLHPGPDIAAPAAASLAGVAVPQALALLAELTRAHLVTEHRPGRYAFHDLLRAYAAELARTVDSDAERSAATCRLLDHYLHTAHNAEVLIKAHRNPIALTAPSRGVSPEEPANAAEAMAWFTTEHQALLAAVELAADAGFDAHAWQLASVGATFLGRRGHWLDWAGVQRRGLDAARRVADRPAQAHAHDSLARVYVRLDRHAEANIHLGHALDLFEALGDRAGQGTVHLGIAWTLEQQGRHREAVAPAHRALELHRAAGHRVGQANALGAIGWYHANLGDHQQAITYCRQALALHQALGDRHGQAAIWDSIGYALHNLGRHDEAITCFQNALELLRDLGDRYNEAEVLSHLGDALRVVGDPDTARNAWQQAAEILDQIGHPADQVRAKLA